MARYFSAAGYEVAVTDIDAERASLVLAELQASGGNGFSASLDTRCEQDWAAFHQRILQEWGGLDVLINNAGVAAAGRFEESTIDDWQWVIDIDLMGVVRGCHRFLPLLRQQAAQGRAGYIVNVSSFAGLASLPGVSAYGTAKAGVIALSEQLLTELADTGIGISVVCPAFVRTGILDDLRSQDPMVRDRIGRWMDKSGVAADDVARDVFQAMRQKRFLVLTHSSTRWAWRFKRWWPERYYRQVSRRAGLVRSRAA